MADTMYSLTMKRGKRDVFIGLMANKERADSIASNLEWTEGWKQIIAPAYNVH
jgi:hypothetical protein